MKLSTHYYALSLDKRTSRLYEGFRDSMFDIQNTLFPFERASRPGDSNGSPSELSLIENFMVATDQHFAHYFAQDPLWIVLMGSREHVSLFKEVTKLGGVFIGELEGDYNAVSPHDLGRLTWPIVAGVLAGTNERLLIELERAALTNDIVVGFDAVNRSVNSDTVLSLFVEESLRMKGSIRDTEHGNMLSTEIDVMELTDDAVETLIEKVLAKGGDVVFLKKDSMLKFQSIALIRRN